jgi:hypothetical protein
MRRSRAALLSVMLVSIALPIAVAPVLARDPAATQHDRTVAYWTKDRIANATPRDFVRTPGGQFVSAKARPPGGGTGSVTGASWTKGGQVLRTTGKVVFTLNSGDYICTGTVVTDGKSDRSIVVSAAHCAWDGADGGFARNWMFIPEFDTTPTYTCSQAKWGCWTASALVVNRGFTSAGGFNDQAVQYDWSFAVVTAAGTKGTTLDVAVGSFELLDTTMATGAKVFDFGYPAAGKYHGKDLIYCADEIFTDPLVANRTFGIDCDMTGGSSGGPWLFPFTESTGIGTVRGVNSYGYSGVKKEYASKFNTTTGTTFGAAKTASTNTIVN